MPTIPFSKIADALITAFTKNETQEHQEKIIVDPLVSKFASWYEKLRNVMDYREEEVILRSAIERILKRRILLGGNGVKTAEPLVRELIWAHYFSDGSLSEAIVEKVGKKIDLYLRLRAEIISRYKFDELQVNEWIYNLLSSDIEYLLHSKKEKELVSNFMYQIMRENVGISDDTEQTKDVQVFIAVRKAFAKDDIAFVRYHLFKQFFGSLTEKSIEQIIANFKEGYAEIQKQLNYPRKDRIYSYIKSRTGVFFILEDLLRVHGVGIRELYQNQEEFAKSVFVICDARYNRIASKVQRAILRSVIFIVLTKTFFAFGVEGTFESIVYGKVFWNSILLNIGIPPLLMVFMALMLKTPGKENSKRILSYLHMVLSEDKPRIGTPLITKKNPDNKPLLNAIFTILWLLTFLFGFGGTVFILSKLHFNFVSQGIFLFFLAIVSFLSYRISLTAYEYTVDRKRGWITPLFDFFFVPFIKVGRYLTEGISQINIFLFILDFIIETPFKVIFGFFEQWFFFLHAKREEL